MALSVEALKFLAFIATYLNQCPLYDRSSYQTQCDLSAKNKYDFIIIGGGSAGTTLASRLTENPNWKVLLIEAGGVPSQLSEAPATFMALQGTEEDWQFKTELGNHCLGLTNQRCNWPQGKALGGGSTINAMLAIKGFKRDYDEWANLGNTRWSWDNIKPYYDKAFKQMQTSTYQSPMPTRAMVLAAAEAMGLPVNDHSVHLGYQDINLTINANQRFNTAKAYIVTANKRRNLCVMTNTAVERVLFRRRDGPKAIGVLLQNEQKLYASKEVIMSAGAVMSPQLLMLSGIGPKSVLQPLRIPQIKELPGVGQNLQDHLMFPGYLVKIPHLPIAVDAKQFLEGYCQTKDGPIGQIDIGEMVGWINTRNDSEYPDIQYMHMTMLKKDQILSPFYVTKLGFNEVSADSIMAESAENLMMTFIAILSKPKSRGQILLASNKAKDAPLIHPGYLTDEHDVETMLGAIRHLNQLVSTDAFAGSKVVDFEIPNCKHLEFNSKKFWTCSLRNFATTLYHPSGTCKIGNDNMAVVDEDLKVHGIDGLRVVDASVMPLIVTGNTNMAVIALAERAADLIKSSH